jgi:hypothetical protein
MEGKQRQELWSHRKQEIQKHGAGRILIQETRSRIGWAGGRGGAAATAAENGMAFERMS